LRATPRRSVRRSRAPPRSCSRARPRRARAKRVSFSASRRGPGGERQARQGAVLVQALLALVPDMALRDLSDPEPSTPPSTSSTEWDRKPSSRSTASSRLGGTCSGAAIASTTRRRSPRPARAPTRRSPLRRGHHAFIAVVSKSGGSNSLTVWVHEEDASHIDMVALDEWLRGLCAT
jgi:hypothetical protein